MVKIRKVIKKGEIIPAVYDPVFKALLTSEECRDYLADLINIVTKIPKEVIKDNVIIRNSEHMNRKAREKKKTSDLIVDVLNNRINLEMNKDYYEGLFSKNNAYQQKIAAEQFISGEDYIEEKKIIQINFDMFTKFDERVIIKFKIMDEERKLVENENYEKYHVNLDKVKRIYYNEKKELTKEEKALLLLTMKDIKEIEKIVEGDDTMEKAKEKLVDLSEDEELVGMYDREIVERKVRNTMIKSAVNSAVKSAKIKAEKKGLQKGLQKGIQKGIQKGLKEGIQQGLKEGIEQGVQQGLKEGEHQAKREMIKNMINNNIDLQTISLVSGLSEQQIEKLIS